MLRRLVGDVYPVVVHLDALLQNRVSRPATPSLPGLQSILGAHSPTAGIPRTRGVLNEFLVLLVVVRLPRLQDGPNEAVLRSGRSRPDALAKHHVIKR
jgi:hypothetical protein